MNIRNVSAFVRGVDSDKRTAEFIISDSTRDRHRTVVNQNGWNLENYKRNPIVGYNHNVYGGFFSDNNPDNIIGRSEVYMEDGKLIGRVTFEPADINPVAEKIYQKVKFGTLRSASVGFSEIGDGRYGDGEEGMGRDNETYYFSGQELVEWSIVNIPSNPSATKRSEYKEPTVAEILDKIKQYEKQYNIAQLHKLSIIDLLRSIEGIKELKLDKAEVQKLSDVYEKHLHTISVA